LRVLSAINGFAGLFAIWLAARSVSVMMGKLSLLMLLHLF